MVPSEGSFVNLGERKTTALIRILDMKEVIVEIVVGVVTAGSLLGGHGCRIRICSMFCDTLPICNLCAGKTASNRCKQGRLSPYRDLYDRQRSHKEGGYESDGACDPFVGYSRLLAYLRA